MAETNVKFYRLGFNNPVTIDVYNLYAKDGNIVFAKVTEGAGEWDSSTSTLSAPTYRIFAGGIHYNIADADALNYVMDQVNTWKGDVTVEGSILNIISKAVSAAQIVALVDATSSNVSAEVVEVEDAEGNKHEKIKLTAAASDSTVVTKGSTAPEEAVENPKNGDYYIKEVAINGSDVPSRTAYIYNGETSTWQALDGNVTAENVYFPDGLLRTAAFGFKSAVQDIQTECAGMNLKSLLEWYLVQEQYPKVSVTQATANAGTYTISLNTPNGLASYMSGASNNALVEVGTSVTVGNISVAEKATHSGKSSYTGTAGKITGMKYHYREDSVDGNLVESDQYSSITPTTNAEYTTNFDTAIATMTLTKNSGFNGINTANASCGVNDKTLSLSTQTGKTVEGENKLTLSWSNNATVSRTLKDSVNITKSYTAFPLSNQDKTAADKKYTVNPVSWTHTAAASTVSYTPTTFTVNAVYPIYTNGVTVSSTYVESACKWTTSSINISDTADGETRVVNGEKIKLYNYKANKKASYYIGAGNQNPISGGSPFIIYIPASAGITTIAAASYNTGSGKWDGQTCSLAKDASAVYINGAKYDKWWGQDTLGAQNILVTFS